MLINGQDHCLVRLLYYESTENKELLECKDCPLREQCKQISQNGELSNKTTIEGGP